MTLPKVMIIRHGEKPGFNDEPPLGFDELGRLDLHSLTIRGWQRAGALVSLFQRPPASSEIETPNAIYAAKRSHEVDGKNHLGARAYQTVLPLAKKLKLTAHLEFGLDDVGLLAQQIKTKETGPVLIAWEHHSITDVVMALQPSPPASAQSITWDGERFDMVWILTAIESKYVLSAEPQNLLDGDEVIDARTAKAMSDFNAPSGA